MTTAIISIRARGVWVFSGRPIVEAEILVSGGAVGRAIAPAGARPARRGHRAARRRRPVRRLRRTRAIASVNGEIAACAVRRRCQPASRKSTASSRSRRYAAQGAARRQRHHRRIHGRGPRRGGGRRAAALGRRRAGGPVSIPAPEIQIFGGGAVPAARPTSRTFWPCAHAQDFGTAMERTAESQPRGRRAASPRRGFGKASPTRAAWPSFGTNEEALDFLVRAIERAGYSPGDEVFIALDVAASEFGSNGRYRLGLEGESSIATVLARRRRSGRSLSDPLCRDPFAEDDREDFAASPPLSATGCRSSVKTCWSPMRHWFPRPCVTGW